MNDDQQEELAGTTESTAKPDRLSRRGRLLVLLGMGQFMVSITLLLIASTSREKLPRWVGFLDVLLVLTIVVTVELIRRAATDKIEDRVLKISYQIATSLPAALLLALWLVADRVIWNTLLPGLAWRTFLLLYALPLGLTAWKANESTPEPG
jgi:hypothetical protein